MRQEQKELMIKIEKIDGRGRRENETGAERAHDKSRERIDGRGEERGERKDRRGKRERF
jgi:hypothetical protein